MLGHPTREGSRLLLISPSAGIGGGIERTMDAVGETWPGPVDRIDLLRPPYAAAPRRPRPHEVAAFSSSALLTAMRSRPKVVLCGLLGLVPVGLAAGRLCGRRPAVLVHGVEAWGSVGTIERRMIRGCSRVLAVSRYTATHFGARAGLDPSRIDVVSIPISSGLELRARQQTAVLGPRDPVLLTVSRVVRSDRFKGHFTVARSLSAVLRAQPAAQWIVVGTGDDLGELQVECRRLGIDNAVRFAGRITDPELASMYEKAAIFVLPSTADAGASPPVGEGFGIVYAEAGAFGVPAIASSRGGGSEEFVTDGVTGLTVDPDDPGALSRGVIRLLEDESFRAQLGRNARARALRDHVPVRFGEQLASLLM